MAHSHSPTNTAKPATAKTTSASPCSCAETPLPQTCCDLICFERPNYFCGHLLTDADLKLEQRYFREKNKLRNRALHGHGVVCGLRLTCDHHCPGHILVAEGYAIDDCGNDLVVCESISFDVVGLLREKGLLIEGKPANPCEPPTKPPECEIKQCFQIVICYDEEETDFTTPFVAGCRPQLTECEPTRICETVRFDVVAELPNQVDWPKDLEKRLEHCFAVLSEGEFAQTFKVNHDAILSVLNGSDPAGETNYQDVFCRLRGYFLLHLRNHPDNYNCTIEEDLHAIVLPGEDREKIHTAFCRLFELVFQNVVSCAMGELVPRCHQPCCAASCVVLGTVEIKNGNVVHVCNCPRSYVWSFANFFELLLATLLGGEACENNPHEGERKEDGVKKHPCCREFKLPHCQPLLAYLGTNEGTMALRATAGIRTLREARTALSYALNFTRTESIPSDIFVGKTPEQAMTDARRLKLSLKIVEQEPRPPTLEPLEAFAAYLLKNPKQPFIAFQKNNYIHSMIPDLQPISKLDEKERQTLEGKIEVAEQLAKKAGEKADALQQQIDDIISKLPHIPQPPAGPAISPSGDSPSPPAGPKKRPRLPRKNK